MGLRNFLCELFDCERYKELETKVDGAHTKLDALVLAVAALSIPACDLSRVEAKLDAGLMPQLSIWATGAYFEGGLTLAISLWIRGETLKENDAWGLDFYFEESQMAFQGFMRGPEIASWDLVNHNLIEAGHGRIGGLAGTARGLVGDSISLLGILHFTLPAPLPSGAAISLRFDDFVDGLADMRPKPLVFTFPGK